MGVVRGQIPLLLERYLQDKIAAYQHGPHTDWVLEYDLVLTNALFKLHTQEKSLCSFNKL